MKYELKYIIEQVLEQVLDEQWAAITSNDVFGKDRNRGNVNPGEWNITAPKNIDYQQKLSEIEPVIRQSQQYKLFLRELDNTNPNNEASLFSMYENFLRYFSIKREDFQDNEKDDKNAALAIVNYFKHKSVNLA